MQISLKKKNHISYNALQYKTTGPPAAECSKHQTIPCLTELQASRLLIHNRTDQVFIQFLNCRAQVSCSYTPKLRTAKIHLPKKPANTPNLRTSSNATDQKKKNACRLQKPTTNLSKYMINNIPWLHSTAF
jgi:hypothetical protein